MTDNKWKSGRSDAPSPWKKSVSAPAARDEKKSVSAYPRPPARENAADSRAPRPYAPRSDAPGSESRERSRNERGDSRGSNPYAPRRDMPSSDSRERPRNERADSRAPRPYAPRHDAPLVDSRNTLHDEPRIVRPSGEMRLYGVNACLAAFQKRPDDLRKVYLIESRIPALKQVLAWCVSHKLGYRVVEDTDLDKLTGSRHHEGICFEMRRNPPLALSELLAMQPVAPEASLLIWLDGVGNPHNLGALLRSAAHFGAGGVIVPNSSSLDLSGAAARVAEGGAEAVTLARVDDEQVVLSELRAAGYSIAATVPRDGIELYSATLASRLVLVFGAEGEGMSQPLIAAADERLMIPGSGVVDSLNIAASAAAMLGEYWRQVRAK